LIFLSVGTQEPFDRLVRAVDAWAAGSGVPVFGQLGALKPGSHRPANFEWREFLDADDYQARVEASGILVAHAGMGSIITALSGGKPLLVMPRRAALGEHRNEHQLATVEKFRGRAGIHVAADETEVAPLLDRLVAGAAEPGSAGALAAEASPELITALRAFIAGS
jgi:UDP-N-acetylglucosamine transferase subunit ALG13